MQHGARRPLSPVLKKRRGLSPVCGLPPSLSRARSGQRLVGLLPGVRRGPSRPAPDAPRVKKTRYAHKCLKTRY